MREEEKELVKKAQKGDSGAFGNLYDKYLPGIYRFVILKVGHRADAEDLSHQVFMNAWQNINKFEFQGFPFSSWLYRIASNAVIDFWRTKKNPLSIDLIPEDSLKDDSKIELALDNKMGVETIKSALTKLEGDQQDIIIMKFVNELSNKEIAEILNKTEGAVRVIQHRALKQLKKHINFS
ncbi:MAG: sigma-70 family RNA polymerase sigma factor [Patescibacteria group bacterium]